MEYFSAAQILLSFRQYQAMLARTPLVEQEEKEPQLEEGDDHTFPTPRRYPRQRRNRKGGRTVAQKF